MTDEERREIVSTLDQLSSQALTLAALYAQAAKTVEEMAR